MTKALRIRRWNDHYENNRSREVKDSRWLPLPNKFDGSSFMELMDHPAGMSHYGAWCLLLAAASRMPVRGLLVADSRRPLTIKDVARMTRGSAKSFEEALPRFIAIGWVEEIDISEVAQELSAALGEDAKGQGAGMSRAGAVIRPLEGELEGKGNRKGEGSARAAPSSSSPKHEPEPTQRERLIRKMRGCGMACKTSDLVEEWALWLAETGGARNYEESLWILTWLNQQAIARREPITFTSQAAPLVADLHRALDHRRRQLAGPVVAPPAKPTVAPFLISKAKQAGINLDGIEGTGHGGQVTVRDVEALIAAKKSDTKAPTKEAS